MTSEEHQTPDPEGGVPGNCLGGSASQAPPTDLPPTVMAALTRLLTASREVLDLCDERGWNDLGEAESAAFRDLTLATEEFWKIPDTRDRDRLAASIRDSKP